MKLFRLQKVIFLLALFLFLPLRAVFAVELSSIYVTNTTSVTSASANYKFYLTLDGSASWAEGESMTITFPSGYALTSFTEDDIDIADDGVDLTTAATCAGSEHMGVSFSGLVATFEMCAGDGGTIASSSVIEIEMGLSATSSGTGSHQVTNPSGVGSYFIALGGTFGSGGSVIVPITVSSGAGVSVTVPTEDVEVEVPGGGGCGSCGETVATEPDPEVTDPEVTDPEVTDPEVTDPEVTDPEVTDPETLPISGGDIVYDVGVSAVDIALPIINDTVSVIVNTLADIEIILEKGNADFVYIEIRNDYYPFVEVEEDVWQGSVPVGFVDDVGTVVVGNDDGSTLSSPLTFDIFYSGLVYEMINGQQVGVADAVVTVFHIDGSPWNAESYNQSSVAVTGDSGEGFIWYIPNGTYIVRVEKEGYETVETVVTTTRKILAPRVLLSRIEELPVYPEVLEPPQHTIGEQTPLPSPSTLVSGSVEYIQNVYADASFTDVALMGTAFAGVAALVAASLVGWAQLWLLLYSFLSQPLLFFAKKKLRKLGIVYHSVTKVPLDLVTVRAFDAQTNRLVKTVVTNTRGEFFLRISRQGTYRLEAAKEGFVFPSMYLKGVEEDGGYVDVYTGQDLVLDQDADSLAVAIPLDPRGVELPVKTLRWQRTKRRIAYVLSPLSVFVSLGVFIVYTTLFTGIILCIQILFYALLWRITHVRRKKTWGIVYDAQSHRPVGNVVIRLFEPKYNKLVDSLLSDAKGRYVFVLGPNEYYVTFAKDGYAEAAIKHLDFKDRKGISFFGVNLALHRDNNTFHG